MKKTLSDVLHESYHQVDTNSGKTFKDTLFNTPNSSELSPEALKNLDIKSKMSPMLAKEQSIIENPANSALIPFDSFGRAMNRLAIEGHVLSKLDPQAYNKLTELTKTSNPALYNSQVAELFPEYAKAIRGSVGHSSNMYEGIEHTLAKDAALKGISPLDTERAKAILTPASDSMKKAAGVAGTVGLMGVSNKAAAMEPGKISSEPTDLLPLSASASQYQAPAVS